MNYGDVIAGGISPVIGAFSEKRYMWYYRSFTYNMMPQVSQDYPWTGFALDLLR